MDVIETVKRYKMGVVIGSVLLILGMLFLIYSSPAKKHKPLGGCETNVEPLFDRDLSMYPNISSPNQETLATLAGYLKYDANHGIVGDASYHAVYRPLKLEAVELKEAECSSNNTRFHLRLMTECATARVNLDSMDYSRFKYKIHGIEFKDVRYQGDYFICKHSSLEKVFQYTYYCDGAVAKCHTDDNDEVLVAEMYFKFLKFEPHGSEEDHQRHVYEYDYSSVC